MASVKQRRAAEKSLENMEAKDPKTKGEILVESGYSETIARVPKKVYDSKGFREILDEIDDKAIIRKWEMWALADTDKRNALDAGKEIMKLKNRYPKEKLDIDLITRRNELLKRPETENKDNGDN
jgi:hypothetical protein